MKDFVFKPNYKIQKDPLIKGYGLIMQIGKDEYIVAGNACRLSQVSADANKPNSQLLSVEEGTMVNGKWVSKRIINGDEFGIKLPPNPYDLASDVHLNEVTVLKVKLF